MQKVLKKIVSILFTLVLISSIGIVSSFAYQVPQNSETAVLKGNEHYSCSGKVIGTFKLFGAKTKRESNRAMTACSMYFNASSKSFKYDKKIKVGIGKDFDREETQHFSQAVTWQLYLKPYGAWNSRAQGEGYICYK